MASGENQSLQIALIILVILTIILGVSTFMFYRQWDEAARVSADTKEDLATATAGVRSAQEEIAKLLTLIGSQTSGSTDADVRAAEEAFQADMKHLSDTFQEERQSWRDAVAFLTTSLGDANTRLAAADTKIRELEQHNEARERIKDEQIRTFADAAAEANRQLEAERAAYAAEIDRMTSQQSQFEESKTQLTNEVNTVRAELANQVGTLTDDRNQWQSIAEQRQREIVALTEESFEVADGAIYRVDQAKGMVWINLGTADQLEQQIIFSVYGPDENNFERVARKGSVEVLRTLGPHMAEARILNDRFTDPILPGDKLYTPVWHPGRREHFAIAGFIDVDNDGVSDRQLLHNVMQSTGAVLDGELDDEGNEHGEITVNTRFLIVGDENDKNAAALGDWKGRAADLGVKPIAASKFLDLAGWTDTHRVVRFGEGELEDYLPPRRDGGIPHMDRTLGPQFQPRRPGRQSTR